MFSNLEDILSNLTSFTGSKRLAMLSESETVYQALTDETLIAVYGLKPGTKHKSKAMNAARKDMTAHICKACNFKDRTAKRRQAVGREFPLDKWRERCEEIDWELFAVCAEASSYTPEYWLNRAQRESLQPYEVRREIAKKPGQVLTRVEKVAHGDPVELRQQVPVEGGQWDVTLRCPQQIDAEDLEQLFLTLWREVAEQTQPDGSIVQIHTLAETTQEAKQAA